MGNNIGELFYGVKIDKEVFEKITAERKANKERKFRAAENEAAKHGGRISESKMNVVMKFCENPRDPSNLNVEDEINDLGVETFNPYETDEYFLRAKQSVKKAINGSTTMGDEIKTWGTWVEKLDKALAIVDKFTGIVSFDLKEWFIVGYRD